MNTRQTGSSSAVFSFMESVTFKLCERLVVAEFCPMPVWQGITELPTKRN
jgi:hypothetical protein